MSFVTLPSSGAAIGAALTSGTTGSVLFVGSGPVFAQDNTNFFWDDTNNNLKLTASTAALFPLTIDKSLSPAATNKLIEFKSNGTQRGYIQFTSADNLVIKGTVSAELWSPAGDGSSAGYIKTNDSAGSVLAYGSQSVTVATGTTNLIFATVTSQVCIGQIVGGASISFLPPVNSNLTSFRVSSNTTAAMTASTELVDFDFDLSAIKTWATGAITTQRSALFRTPTYAFAAASVVTTATTLSIQGAPIAGTNATITNAFAFQAGAATTQVSAAGLVYSAIDVPAHTLTLTGTTQVTSVGPAGVRIGQLTVTDSSAVTVDNAAALYIAAAPVAAGSVTLTNKYSLWVDAGVSRFDDSILIGGTAIETGSTNTLLIANGTAPDNGVTDSVIFYSSDNAAGHTIPSFYCEGTQVIATGQADSVSSVRVKMRINGTVVTLLAI